MSLRLLVMSSLVCAGLASHAAAEDARSTTAPGPMAEVFTPPADARGDWAMTVDPTLPNVLIIGDSISIGYTRPLRNLLYGEANVFRPMKAGNARPENCGDTRIGLNNLDKWLGANRWDVIHFNWGLWDLCYRNPASKTQGNRDKVNGTLSVPPDEYERNLEALVERLEATGAKLIWANTTVVPTGEAGRFEGDDLKYNAIADRIMQRHGIVTNDLFALTRTFAGKHFAGDGDVHFKPDGYNRIAQQVAEKIRTTLPTTVTLTSDSKEIAVTASPAKLVLRTNVDLQPDENGLVLSHRVTLPAFERGAYYRPFSGGVAVGNRVEPVAFDSLAELQGYKPSKTRAQHDSLRRGQFMLLQTDPNTYLAIVPMLSSAVASEFAVEDGGLLLKSTTFGTDRVRGDVPLLVWAHGPSPYAATQAAWKLVIESGYVETDWRHKKVYPPMYEYLGWCSWEFYKTKISEKILTAAVQTIEKSGAPIRWVIVDDGYLNHTESMLIDFKPDPKKFPNGWPAVTSLKNPEKIRWMGVWRNMAGYMQGIAPQHEMADLADHLMPDTTGKRYLPKDNATAAQAFFDKMVLDSKDAGFDFTKVDFQSRMPEFYQGTGNAVRAMRFNNVALEEATKKFDLPLLNCIAQLNINSMQTKYSALTRSSPDYHQSDKNKTKCNTYQSFANHLWMGQTVWGDLDMFHSYASDAQPMAVARAISGGPVYVSDEPSKIDPDLLKRFALADGKLLRTRAPATLLPESFFVHPFRDEVVFRVVAPLDDNVAAVGLFNFSEASRTLPAALSASDYPHAGELLQPAGGPWPVPEAGLLIYDPEEKKAVTLTGSFKTEVADFSAKLFLLYPKTHGWAVIGRVDKFLPAAAVKVISVSPQKIVVSLAESGPLAVWSEAGTPQMAGATFEPIGDNLYLADLPIVVGETEVTITR